MNVERLNKKLKQATIDRINEDEIRRRYLHQWHFRIFGGLVVMMALWAVGSVICWKCGAIFLGIGAVAFGLIIAPMFGRSP